MDITKTSQLSQIRRDRKENGGCQETGEEKDEELLFNGYRPSPWDDETVPEMEKGNNWTIWMFLMSLNYILQNGENGKFYVY